MALFTCRMRMFLALAMARSIYVLEGAVVWTESSTGGASAGAGVGGVSTGVDAGGVSAGVGAGGVAAAGATAGATAPGEAAGLTMGVEGAPKLRRRLVWATGSLI